jgi:hypothetical protein
LLLNLFISWPFTTSHLSTIAQIYTNKRLHNVARYILVGVGENMTGKWPNKAMLKTDSLLTDYY